MPAAHASHEVIELIAAISLLLGGGLILVRAAVDRRALPAGGRALPGGPAPVVSSLAVSSVAGPRSALAEVRRLGTLVAVGLSLGAGTIHLAAGPAHVRELGDLGLAFYWAAIFQGAFAVALFSRPRSSALAWVGILGNIAVLGAWAWSRIVGLPGIAGGPESVGIADGTAVLLQGLLVGLLTIRLRGLDGSIVGSRTAEAVRSIVTSSLVVILGVVALATTIAVADAGAGGGHETSSGGHVGHGAPLHVP